MNALEALMGSLQPQANAAATQAASAAVDNLSQRPFSVVVTIDPTTRDWITLLAIGLLIGGVLLKKI